MNKFTKVRSSLVESVNYNENEKELFLEFKNGKVYKYKNVPKNIYDQMLVSESIGKYINMNIKNNMYQYEAVKDIKVEY